jgi:hypothetical protein
MARITAARSRASRTDAFGADRFEQLRLVRVARGADDLIPGSNQLWDKALADRAGCSCYKDLHC